MFTPKTWPTGDTEPSRFRAMIESVRDAVIMADSEGRIIGWNRGAHETFGYDVDEIAAIPLALLMPQRYRAAHKRGFAHFAKTGESAIFGKTIEMCALRKDGTEFPCEVTVNSWVASGEMQFNAFVRDITDRRRADAALLMQARVLESMNEAVVVTDHEGIITYANRALERSFGFEPGELIGRLATTLHVIPLEETARRVETVVAAVSRAGRWTGECQNRRKDGTTFTSKVSVTELVVDDRKLFVSVQEDLTEQQELRSKLLMSDRMASVGTLAAGVAHEINNPLAYVTANLDLVVDEIERIAPGLAPEDVCELRDMLASAKEGAERVRKIVRGLKTFSRADKEAIVPLDVTRVLEWSINMTFNEIRHRARVVKDYGETALVDADEARLGQVFVNLLVNAAHSIPEGRADANVIRIVTGSAAGRVFVEVRDTGSGIPTEHLGRIFDPFFTTKPIGQGTGLGLSICHSIVTALNGEISVDSTVGLGTVFRVSLPVARQGRPRETKAPSMRPDSARRGRVLVIDDDVVVGATIRRVLKDHDTHVATCAREGLGILANDRAFDVILCDLMMPDMTGIEFYDELARAIPERVDRVVFVTGGAFTAAASSFLDSVANETLEKPFQPRALRALVQRFLR